VTVLFLGLALFNGCILPISLPDFVYKRLCDPTHQPEFSDLQQISPVLADGLQKLLGMYFLLMTSLLYTRL